MLSLEAQKLAKELKKLSVEDKKWLLQKLVQQIALSEVSNIDQSETLGTTKKTFNITPAVPESGYQDTSINHDQILADNLSNDSWLKP